MKTLALKRVRELFAVDYVPRNATTKGNGSGQFANWVTDGY
jgi:hypothetical protein